MHCRRMVGAKEWQDVCQTVNCYIFRAFRLHVLAIRFSIVRLDGLKFPFQFVVVDFTNVLSARHQHPST